MKTSDAMTTREEEYLRYRRALGYALRIEGEQLLNFGHYADQSGHSGPLTSELVLRWLGFRPSPAASTGLGVSRS